MKPRYLLDEQISPRVADILTRSGIDALAVARSPLSSLDDRALLTIAVTDKRLLATYNVDDFVPLFGDCLKEGRDPVGIVLINARTIPTSDIRGLARALRLLAERIDGGAVDPSGGLFLTRK